MKAAGAVTMPVAENSDGTVFEWKLLFLLGIYTGQRLGDCCTLRWCDVNLERGVIQLIPRKTRKHMKGVPVTIPIHSELREALGACPPLRSSGGTYVLPTLAEWYLGGEHWRISRGLEEIFRRAGIKTSVKLEGRKTATPDATFHSLRHTFVSFAVNGGVPLAVVQSIVGHTSNAMTRHYYHENEEVLRKAVAAIPSLTSHDSAPAEETDALSSEMLVKLRKMYETLKGVFGDM